MSEGQARRNLSVMATYPHPWVNVDEALEALFREPKDAPLFKRIVTRWPETKIPSPKLPIDIELRNLKSNRLGNEVKLRSADELRANNVLNIYQTARWGISKAVLKACEAVTYDYEMRERIAEEKRLLKEIRQMQAKCEELAASSRELLEWFDPKEKSSWRQTLGFNTVLQGDSPPPARPNFEKNKEAAAAYEAAMGDARAAARDAEAAIDKLRGTGERMNGLASILKLRASRSLPRKSAEIWRPAFVQGMSELWYLLTGGWPEARSEPFRKFVYSAWLSAGGVRGKGDEEWERQVKNGLAAQTERDRTAPWDARDRDIKGTLAPGEETFTWDEFLDQNRKRETATRAEAARIIAALKDEDPSVGSIDAPTTAGLVALKFLSDVWRTGTAERRSFLENEGITEVLPTDMMADLRTKPAAREVARRSE